MTQATPDLISPDRIPHGAVRRAETYLKRQTFKVENAAVLRQQKLYADAYHELQRLAFYIAAGIGLTATSTRATWALWRDTLLASAAPILQQLAEAIYRDTIRTSAAAQSGSYYGRLWLLDGATHDDVTVQMRPLFGDVASMLSQSQFGKDLRDQYALELDDLTLQVRRAIGTGISKQEDTGAMLARIALAMGMMLDARRGIGTVRANFARVQTLTRTAINSASISGAVQAYDLNPALVTGLEWCTANDERVCPYCMARDGKVYTVDFTDRPPLHPNCRCTLVPHIHADAQNTRKGVTLFTVWVDERGLAQALQDFLKPTK